MVVKKIFFLNAETRGLKFLHGGTTIYDLKQDIKDMIRHWFGSTLSPNTHPCEFTCSMCENKPCSIYKAASFHSRSQGAINPNWHKLTASSCYFIKQRPLDIGLACPMLAVSLSFHFNVLSDPLTSNTVDDSVHIWYGHDDTWESCLAL